MRYNKIIRSVFLLYWLDLCGRLCDFINMATNIELDNELLSKAMELGKIKTKRQAVNEALLEYVKRREQLEVLDLFGSVDFDEDYDYKAQRSEK